MSPTHPAIVRRSLARSVVTGILAAFAGVVVFALALMVVAPEGGWVLVGAVLAAPFIAITGAVGGVVVHHLRGSAPAVPASSRHEVDARQAPSGLLRVAGGIAGLSWSGIGVIADRVWPLLSLALIPLCIMAGVAFTWRVNRATGMARARGMGIIVASVAYQGAWFLLWAVGATQWSSVRSVIIPLLALAAGLVGYLRTKRGTQNSETVTY